jgi:hypothetical protein
MSPPEKLPVVVIACKVFQNLLDRLLPDHLASQISFMDYGLHRVPSNLTWTVQGAIDSVEESSLVVLGYGLCGNGLKGIQAGKHTLLVPRTDDCIAMLLGSYKDYMREFESVPGTYYLSKGWLESGSNPLQEYQEYVQKYGEESAQWIMDQQYQHYERLVLVAHNQEDLEKYRPQALEVARYCEQWGMRYEEILGSEIFVQRLAELIPVVAERGLDAKDQLGNDFLLIPPGGEIRQDQYFR